MRSFIWLLSLTCSICAAQAFDFASLKGKAKSLSDTAYVAPSDKLPPAIAALNWDQHQSLRFERDAALWTQSNSHFRAEFFHLGMFTRTPVKIFEVLDGAAEPIHYDSSLFDYSQTDLSKNERPEDIGFAGFRLHAMTDWERDLISFLGASYFRAVGSSMQYGLSARGLAINTAHPDGEEFPRFTEFYLQKPDPGSNQVEIYALMDSPSVTGAYHFIFTPGEPAIIRVDAALYPRSEVERWGIAPLTSMYQVGENDRRMDWDWRTEIHDSDGLAMHRGNGEWIWRPLTNPATLHYNTYLDENPRGFGLLQRDRNFDHYQDDGVFYDRRPSVWVEPIGDWGKGAVALTEIPTNDETFDNIVAYWQPAEPMTPGEEVLISYNLYWGNEAPVHPQLAQVQATHTGLGGVIGQERSYYSYRFVIDFDGPIFNMLGRDPEITAEVSTSAGEVEIVSARPIHSVGGYRARFDLIPPEDSNEPINLRLYLKKDDLPLSETWLYQWTPPVDRDYTNPKHQ